MVASLFPCGYLGNRCPVYRRMRVLVVQRKTSYRPATGRVRLGASLRTVVARQLRLEHVERANGGVNIPELIVPATGKRGPPDRASALRANPEGIGGTIRSNADRGGGNASTARRATTKALGNQGPVQIARPDRQGRNHPDAGVE